MFQIADVQIRGGANVAQLIAEQAREGPGLLSRVALSPRYWPGWPAAIAP